MSGRVRTTLADGRTVTGFRKTLRQNPRRDPRERLKELAQGDEWPVHMVFRLPKSLEGFVAPGPHGLGVTVLGRGYVRISSDASEKCFQRARVFLAAIAKERPAFTTQAIITGTKEPGRSFGRWLTVIGGWLVVSNGLTEPLVFEVV